MGQRGALRLVHRDMERHWNSPYGARGLHSNAACERPGPGSGGYNYNDDNPFVSAELYDPTTRIWSRSVNLNTGRYNHTATLLPDGKVLVTGGLDAFGTTLNSAELFDPGLTQTAGGNLN